MLLKDEEYRSIKFAARLPGKYHKWTHFGAQESDVCPQNGLPIWRNMSLDQKLTYIPNPNTTQGLTCGKLGKLPWSKKKAHDLRFLDSYGHTTLIPYDALHDPHLAAHHKKKSVQQMLTASGHVSENNAVCLLKQLNRYREAKRLMNLDEVHYQINLKESELQEERRLRKIEERLERNRDKIDVEGLKQHVARHKEQVKKQVEEQIRRIEDGQKRKERYLFNIMKIKEKERNEKMRERTKRADEVRKRHDDQSELIRQRLLYLTGKYKKRHAISQRYCKKKEIDRRKNAIEEVRRKWENKTNAMNEEAKKQQAVIADILKKRQVNIEKRNKKAEKVKRIQEQGPVRRTQRRFVEIKPTKPAKIENDYVRTYRITIAKPPRNTKKMNFA